MSKKSLVLGNILYILVALTLIVPIIIYITYFNEPIVESHAYRQTQTAIVSYWMLHDGFKIIDYLMPVLGYPWSAPLEFPLYQFIVAKLSYLTGIKLEIVGRTFSLFLFYICLIPLFSILKNYGKFALIIGLVTFITSPIDLMYSRAFLIEYFSTLFSLINFCIYLKIKRQEEYNFSSISLTIIFIVTGSIAALQKITTYIPVLLVCIIDNSLYLKNKKDHINHNLKTILFNLIIAFNILPAFLFSKYSDKIKKLGLITEFLSSGVQNAWLFGDFQLRTSLEYWFKVFGYRLIFLGGLLIPLLLFIALLILKKRKINRESILAILIGITGPLIFGPLFLVHDYYFISSIPFLIIGFSIYLSNYFKNKILFVTLIIIINLSIFCFKYLPQLNNISEINNTSLKVGRFLSNNMNDNEASLIFGMDWSSVIPYYSNHYSVMIPFWYNVNNLANNDLSSYVGKKKIGAVVICNNSLWPLNDDMNIYERFMLSVKGNVFAIDSCQIKLNN